MADTNFTPRVTSIVSVWLQAVNDAVYRANSAITGVTTALYRTLLAKLSDTISVKDFGAVGDGLTNDTAAFVLALATLKRVFVPKGTYLVDQIALPAGSAHLEGETMEGVVFKFTGTSVKGIYTDNLISHVHFNHLILKNFTMDCTSLPNAATSFGLYLAYAWGNTIEGVRDINLPASAYALGSGTEFYTTVFTNCEFKAVYLHGASGADRVTTITFVGLSSQYVNLENVTAINFFAPTMQGSYATKFDFTIANKCNIFGGDIEGSGFFRRFNGGNCTDNHYWNPDFSGFSGTLETGTNTLTDDAYNNAWQYSPERGTATVAMVAGTSGTITLDNASIYWTRRGDRLFYNGKLHVSGVAAPVGELTVTGLPKTAKANPAGSGVAIACDGLAATATTSVVAYVQGGGTTMNIRKFAAGNNSAMAGDVQAGSTFWISGNYAL